MTPGGHQSLNVTVRLRVGYRKRADAEGEGEHMGSEAEQSPYLGTPKRAHRPQQPISSPAEPATPMRGQVPSIADAKRSPLTPRCANAISLPDGHVGDEQVEHATDAWLLSAVQSDTARMRYNLGFDPHTEQPLPNSRWHWERLDVATTAEGGVAASPPPLKRSDAHSLGVGRSGNVLSHEELQQLNGSSCSSSAEQCCIASMVPRRNRSNTNLQQQMAVKKASNENHQPPCGGRLCESCVDTKSQTVQKQPKAARSSDCCCGTCGVQSSKPVLGIDVAYRDDAEREHSPPPNMSEPTTPPSQPKKRPRPSPSKAPRKRALAMGQLGGDPPSPSHTSGPSVAAAAAAAATPPSSCAETHGVRPPAKRALLAQRL